MTIAAARPRRGRAACLGLSCLALVCLATANARTPRDLAPIQRETHIARTIFESALRSEWQGSLRVNSVTAEYLVDQGVVFSIRVSTPWLSVVDDGTRSITLGNHFAIPDVPPIVENILQKLDINIEPLEPEALEDLRAVRSEQRKLRLQQRDIRAQLRAKHRDLVRGVDDDARVDLERDIDALERELEAVDAQYDALHTDIERQMERIGKSTENPQGDAKGRATPAVAATVAKVVCDYGATLKSLDADEHLTVVVRDSEKSRYFVFKGVDVQRCSQDDMKPERLLDSGYQY